MLKRAIRHSRATMSCVLLWRLSAKGFTEAHASKHNEYYVRDKSTCESAGNNNAPITMNEYTAM